MLSSTFAHSGASCRIPLCLPVFSCSAQVLVAVEVVDAKASKKFRGRHSASSYAGRIGEKPWHAVLKGSRPATCTVSALNRSPDEIFKAHDDAASALCQASMETLWSALSSNCPGLQEVPMAAELSYQRSLPGVGKLTEMYSWQYKSDRLRRVRLLAIQGEAFKGFNCCCYPDLRFDLPLLGVELLVFGGKRVLLAADFQPLHQSEDYLERHTGSLADVYSGISPLCTAISQRHYSPDRYRSHRILFYRSANGVEEAAMQAPHGELFTAYQAYIEQYTRQLSSAKPNGDSQQMDNVAKAQNGYNAYMAENDPAGPMLVHYFGKELTERFQKEFLFGQVARGVLATT